MFLLAKYSVLLLQQTVLAAETHLAKGPNFTRYSA